MLRKKDKDYVKKRKKKWDLLGFTYRAVGWLSKNHSLNCGCYMCEYRTFEKRYRNKQERLQSKRDIKNNYENNNR